MSLDAGDGDDADDVICGAAARKIVHRSGEALRDGAVSVSAGEALDQLVADVAGVDVGEDEDVRLSRNGEPGAFEAPTESTMAASSCISPSRRISGASSCASAVASTTFPASSFFADPFVEWEQRDARLGFHQRVPGARGVDGDVREPFRVGLDLEAAIGEHERPVFAVGAVGNHHDEKRS